MRLGDKQAQPHLDMVMDCLVGGGVFFFFSLYHEEQKHNQQKLIRTQVGYMTRHGMLLIAALPRKGQDGAEWPSGCLARRSKEQVTASNKDRKKNSM